jgi:uncharacterized protein (TIGR03086 family)
MLVSWWWIAKEGCMDVDMYERALARTGKTVAGTSKAQLDDATPCSDWQVRDLLNHIIGGLLAFAAGAKGEARALEDGIDHTTNNHVAEYEEAARSAIEGFRSPGAMEGNFAMSWGESPASMVLFLALTDAAVHGWDLAKATGQEAVIDDDIAEVVYAQSSQMMEPNGSFPRGDNFGPPLDVPADAPAPDRALAYLGRQP